MALFEGVLRSTEYLPSLPTLVVSEAWPEMALTATPARKMEWEAAAPATD